MAIDDYSQLYADAGQQYNIDPRLLMAQGKIESAGDPNAVNSDTNATGIAQLIPATAKSLGVTNPKDPKQAIPAQAKLMRENLDRYGDIPTAVTAYHGGTNPQNWGPKTHAYASKVMSEYQNGNAPDDIEQLLGAPTSSAPANEPDDIEQLLGTPDQPAVPETTSKNSEASQKANKKPIGVWEDLAKTAPSAVAKGIGAIPQFMGYGVNALANTLGEGTYGIRSLMGYPEDAALHKKLTNLNPIYTGNTLADPLIQSGNAVAGLPAPPNPLSGNIIHDPETMLGRYENALIQGIVAGKSGSELPQLRTLPIIGAAVAGQTAAENAPDSPSAQLAATLVGGGTPVAIKSLRLRSTPQDLANNVLQKLPGSTDGLTPNNITSTEIIPGSKPTLAQITNNPNIALLERQLQAKNPAAFKIQEDANENARQNHFAQASGTPEDIEALENERDTKSSPLYEQARKQPLQTEAINPVLSGIDNAVEEVGEGSEAGKTLLSIKKKIQGALPSIDEETGKAKNPTQSPLVQIYREERDNLQKPSTADGAYAATVKSVIQPIVKNLGDAIESQSEPFAKAQQTYRDISPKIDAARWLQGLKLTDASGRFTLAKVKNALDNAKRLQSSSGLNAAKNISPNQMQALQNLHDDLFRRENVARASMPRGSNTAQNLLTEADTQSALGGANKLMHGVGANVPELIGSMGGSAIGSLVGLPGIGAFAGDLTAHALKGASSKRMQAATNSLQDYVANPENYKQYLLNKSNDTFSHRLLNNLVKNQ